MAEHEASHSADSNRDDTSEEDFAETPLRSIQSNVSYPSIVPCESRTLFIAPQSPSGVTNPTCGPRVAPNSA
jgi:hypothetical protein